MEQNKKKRIRRYTAWILAVAVTVLLACMPLLAAGEDSDDTPQASHLSDTAQLRDISTGIRGGGTLTGQDSSAITLPAEVKLTEYLVKNGDTVTHGQALARVDRVSVMTAITQVQETMTCLKEQIADAKDDTARQTVTATAGGRVKAVYAQEGDRVEDVLLEHGALAVLSLDGRMAVQVTRSTRLSGGDRVCVTFDDGTEAEGRVESNLEGVLTVTVEDAGYAIGENVKLTTEDGDRIGSGALYVYSQWNVMAASGRISGVQISEGDTVSAGKTLFRLTDTGETAEYTQLLRQYGEYEELMLELFQMYQSESVTAPCDGMVTGVDESGAYMLSDQGIWEVTLLANAPNGDDETVYVNYVGCVREVGLDGLILKLNPTPLEITDYMDLSQIPMDEEAMTEEVIFRADVPFYELEEQQWVQIDRAEIAAGDILLLAGEAGGEAVWAVRVEKAQSESQPEVQPEVQPTTPMPEQGDGETEQLPSDGENPSQPEQNGGMADMSGMAGMGAMGSMIQEEAETLYGLETVTVASVTPLETMTLDITVDEQDVSDLYVGQEAEISVEALSGQSFDAVISSISGTGENSGGSSKFTVTLTLDRAEDMLIGMSAYVVIPLESLENVLTIPVAALTELDGRSVVYTEFDENKEAYGNPVSVTTGLSDGEYVQILSGIGEGERIYYSYYDTLVISDSPESGSIFR